MMRAVVTGAGGFIGGHLVARLKAEGYWVRGVDLKKLEWGQSAADEFCLLDLRQPLQAGQALQGDIDEVYALAADMGGMGFISYHHAAILDHNLSINLNMAKAAVLAGVKRYFFASSACVYPQERQQTTEAPALREDDAYPANPDTAYGWEKLLTERLLRHYAAESGLTVRIARFHNIYGPRGTWCGGREKAPAALCRKVAEAKLFKAPSIDVWGDGRATRSYLYVDECVEGIRRLMASDYGQPLNLGSTEQVSVDELARLAMDLAHYQCQIVHVDGPQGVRGRGSDNTRIRQVLGWAPSITLRAGLSRTYAWIEGQVRRCRS